MDGAEEWGVGLRKGQWGQAGMGGMDGAEDGWMGLRNWVQGWGGGTGRAGTR